MAVETHHLRLFPPQLQRNREIFSGGENDRSGSYNVQLGFAPRPISFCNPSAPAPAVTSESGLTFGNLPAAMASRKRPREPDRGLSFLGEDFSSLIQHQMLDVDRLILHHVEKVRVEMMERLKRFIGRILAAVEEGLSKRLRAKEEEIERVSKLNWALEERIRVLCVENQMWRDLARSNEAAAQVLRAHLEQALAAAAAAAAVQTAAVAREAESCCCGENNADQEGAAADDAATGRACRCCREMEPAVLLLPCRHLCLCAACAPAVASCPVCGCPKNGSVLVNMS